MVEILIIVVIIGILALITIPRASVAKDRIMVNSARQEVAAAIATARAAAIQKGRPSKIVFASSSVTVYATTSAAGTLTKILGPISMDRAFGVSLVPANAADSVVYFEARGFASPRLSSGSRYVITGRNKKDSVCVTSTGQILPRGCTQ